MLDFTKSFDTLQWDFMFESLKYFNFGPSFIRWLKTVYHKPKACIKNNGYISDWFEISRGIRQGCPVSALIFVLLSKFWQPKQETILHFKAFTLDMKKKR